MIGEQIPVRIFMLQMIPNLTEDLCHALDIKTSDRAVGLISTDCDDLTYIALDEATKVANVRVAYGRSLYAGASNASTPYAGEVIGVLAGPTPAEVSSGLKAAKDFLEGKIGFQKTGPGESSVYLSHCISRTGTYLSGLAGVNVGEPLAYLVAPPVEAILGLDAALKAADVKLACFFSPPTETNFAGALLHGSQSACQSACEAFARAVIKAAETPQSLGGI